VTNNPLPKEHLEKLGIKNTNIHRNLSVPELYKMALAGKTPSDPDTPMTSISNTGALVAYSGKRTGRSPLDKRVVLDSQTK
jgi:phosphoenolpyruvate carboxykinase (ATP)